jgi:eukaryotic-like serine/threonine-protein kinase
MPLSPGSRIGGYEVISPLGEGGMGEVYRARDTKLERDVALKILPDSFAADRDRLMRFEREAKTLASLNHPHIAQIYGIEDRALVMELVEGETLAEHLARGPIPYDDALSIARQIADGLEAAHRAGIVHRDLKPANVKVRPDGAVKVLDFGLAKPGGAGLPAGDIVLNPPTITSPAMTMQGVILGTAAYMAPEQARGRPVDSRADVWAFGCVLYEMLTGRRAFAGDDITETLAAVVTKEPDWSALPPAAPHVASILQQCLAKDPRRRLRDICDVMLLLERGGEAHPAATRAPASIAPKAATAAACALSVVITAGATWLLMAAPPPPPAPRLDLHLHLRSPLYLEQQARPAFVISADGTQLVYVAAGQNNPRLMHRSLADAAEREIPESDGAMWPFLSPDGTSVGFFQGGKLKRMPLSGGPAVVLADAPDPWGACWTADDVIVYNPIGLTGLWQVPAAGGVPRAITVLDTTAGDSEHGTPQPLPLGHGVVFATYRGSGYGDGDIRVLSVRTGQVKQVYQGAGTPYFVAPDRLLVAREGRLLALPFDLDRLEVTGPPVVLADDLFTESILKIPQFAASLNGTVILATGGLQPPSSQIVWIDRRGLVTPITEPGPYGEPRLSPDERQIAFARVGSDNNVWIYELARGVSSPLTANGVYNFGPSWHPDGRSVVFSSSLGGVGNLFVTPVTAPRPAPLIPVPEHPRWRGEWSRDGKLLAYEEQRPATRTDLFLLDVESQTTRPFRTGPFFEGGAKFSPDGRWLAYWSDETGRSEVYVAPVDDPEASIRVSSGGGRQHQWAGNGRSLILVDARGAVVEVELVPTGSGLSPSRPRELFEMSNMDITDISGDGQRFLALRGPAPPRLETLRVIINSR